MYSTTRKLVLVSSIALALASASGAAFAETPCDKDKAHQAGSTGQKNMSNHAGMGGPNDKSNQAGMAGKNDKSNQAGMAGQNDKPHQAGIPGQTDKSRPAGTPSQEITQARQESQISTSFSLNPYLRANDLEVSVDMGTATLTGTVEEDTAKELAEQIASSVTGINTVDNQIIVAADYAPTERNPAERGFGGVVDDATITATVKSKLLWSKNTQGLDMNVDTENGKVTLRGAAESDTAKAFATNLAKNTRGVVSVDNQLVVDSSKPKSQVADNDLGKDSASAVSDGWITTKVTSTLMYSANVESNNIEVTTDEGIVTLSGKVDSGAERALAIELAENIRGVKSVEATGLTI